MKKSLYKFLAAVLAAVLVFCLGACGAQAQPTQPATDAPTQAQQTAPSTEASAPTEPATDWTVYTDWVTTDWDSKTIRYQFVGSWELAEYGMNFSFLLNLYEDGSALIGQRNILSAASYQQFGYWSEETTEDGNEISLDTLYCTPVNAEDDLIAHEYHYDLYEESDGNYSFGYTFGIAPGSYFRTADMVGSPEITYTTLEQFYEAVDHVSEAYRFVSASSSMEGFSAVISVASNNRVSAQLMTEYEGKVVSAHEDTGSLLIQADESGNVAYTLVIADVEIPVEVNEDGSFADFNWTCNWDNQGVTVDFTMTQTDAVVEDAAA